MSNYTDKFSAVCADVGVDPSAMHAAAATLLMMDVEQPAFRNMLRDIGRDRFAKTETIGDIKRVILGHLVAN